LHSSDKPAILPAAILPAAILPALGYADDIDRTCDPDNIAIRRIH